MNKQLVLLLREREYERAGQERLRAELAEEQEAALWTMLRELGVNPDML